MRLQVELLHRPIMTTIAILSGKCERRVSDSTMNPINEAKTSPIGNISCMTTCTIRSLMTPPSLAGAAFQDIEGEWSSSLDLIEQLTLVEKLVGDDSGVKERTSQIMTYQEDSTWDEFCEHLPLDENC